MAVMQGTNGQQTEGSSAFETERARLITDISLEMGQMVTNLTTLQGNLDTIITIGQEFEQLSQLWKHFHASAYQLAEDDDDEVYQVQSQSQSLEA